MVERTAMIESGWEALAQGAGRVATWLAWDYSTLRGERAIANGWLHRAGRLLSDLEPCAEQGWLALREASMVLGHDPERSSSSPPWRA